MPLIDADQIRQAWQILIEPGALTEIRVIDGVDRPNGKPGIFYGYFSDPDTAISALGRLHGWAGVYIVPSPIDPVLASRGSGSLRWGKRGGTTSDADILYRRWILIDVDAKRRGRNGQEVKDIPSTDVEQAATAATAADIVQWLATFGWPEPVVGNSGNGTHIEYRCELPTASDLPQRVLQALAKRYDTSEVSVDPAVFNPARIWRLPGTRACKGGGSTTDRPWRMARILSAPLDPALVSETAILAMLDAATPCSARAAEGQPDSTPTVRAQPSSHASSSMPAPTPYVDFDPIQIVKQAGLSIESTKTLSDGGTLHVLSECPCDRKLCDGTSSVTIAASGAVGLTCMHASCEYSRGARSPGQSWTAFRALHDTSIGQRESRDDVIARARSLADAWPAPAAAASSIADLVDSSRPAQPPIDVPTPSQHTDASGRVLVDSGLDWQTQRDLVFGALAADKRIWLFDGSLAVIGHDRQMLQLSPRDGSLDSAIVDRCAVVTWRIDAKTNAWVPKPSSLSPRVVSMVDTKCRDPIGRTELREVISITSSPLYSPDGELFASDGWSEKTKTLILDCVPVELPASMSAAHSLEVLREVYADYPFVSQADLDNIIAAMLVPLVRPMIAGPVPFFAVHGNQPGVGKSKIIKTIQAMHGLDYETTTLDTDEKDLADATLVKLGRGLPMVAYDNIKHHINSEVLENIVTSEDFSGRLKNYSKDGKYKVRVMFTFTGNGMTMSRDFARRGLHCTIRDTSGEPTSRVVREKNLEAWVARHRSELLSHLLQMVQDWLAAGRPAASYTDTTFPAFCDVVGGIVEHAGGLFWANAKEARDDSRDDSDWGVLLAEMARIGTPLLPKEIVDICERMAILGDVMGGGGPASMAAKVGKALRKNRNVVLYGYQLETKIDGRTQQTRYSAVEATNTPRTLYDAMH